MPSLMDQEWYVENVWNNYIYTKETDDYVGECDTDDLSKHVVDIHNEWLKENGLVIRKVV